MFLSAVVIGGIVGHLQQTGAAPEMAVNEPVIEAGMDSAFDLSIAEQCQPTDAGAGAPNASSDAQPATPQVLSGSVRSSAGCEPIAGAKIEFWPAGPQAAQPETLFVGADGHYNLQCDLPDADTDSAGYIYLRVSADGYDTLTTQYTPRPNLIEDQFDIVLQPGK